MAFAVFISYRRADTGGSAGRLYDHLVNRFGEASVFKDIDSIPLGTDFRSSIANSISASDLTLVVIGRHFLSINNELGTPRLFDPSDFVATEIAAAIESGKNVIPVLVDDAQMPKSEQLPASIRKLSYLNAIELRHDKWTQDFASLLHVLEQIHQGIEAEKHEDVIWTTACETNTLEGYLDYVAKYPRGKHSQAAAEAMRVLQERSREKQERDTWLGIVQTNTIEAFRQYLDSYPSGKYTAQALSRIDELASAQQRDTRGEQLEFADLLRQAEQHFESAQYNEAWQKYRQVLAVAPAEKRAITGLDRVQKVFDREKEERRKKDRVLLIIAVVVATLVSIAWGVLTANW